MSTNSQPSLPGVPAPRERVRPEVRKWSCLISRYYPITFANDDRRRRAPIVEAPTLAEAVARLAATGLLDDAFALQMSPIDGRSFVDNCEVPEDHSWLR